MTAVHRAGPPVVDQSLQQLVSLPYRARNVSQQFVHVPVWWWVQPGWWKPQTAGALDQSG
jgi:hypothetical protein